MKDEMREVLNELYDSDFCLGCYNTDCDNCTNVNKVIDQALSKLQSIIDKHYIKRREVLEMFPKEHELYCNTYRQGADLPEVSREYMLGYNQALADIRKEWE